MCCQFTKRWESLPVPGLTKSAVVRGIQNPILDYFSITDEEIIKDDPNVYNYKLR